jgi:DNA-binding NarL/FixJ family response regulator
MHYFRTRNYEICRLGSNSNAAVRPVEAHQPDVVLMGIAMPGLNGLEATKHMAREQCRA